MDHISNLPDDVLCHILSFLKTKAAAMTSILSKRWRNLFALVPNLDIDDYTFIYPEEGKEKRADIRQLFVDFVDRVLNFQSNSSIKKFSLYCLRVDSDRVDGWIRNVMVRGVSDLSITIILDRGSAVRYQLSPQCFKNKKLVKLQIGFGIDIGWLDGSIFLPMLKTLVLGSVWLSVDKFEFLLQGLLVLEELVLVYIGWNDLLPNVYVSSASLKTLRIHGSGVIDTLSFDTPSLVYFCYAFENVKDYSVAEMDNLFEARINLSPPINDSLVNRRDHPILPLANVGKLMNVIRNVRCLEVSPNTLELLSLCCKSMPVFNNLKSLTIMSNKMQGWQAMPVLVRSCPHLETLVLKGLLHRVRDQCGDACDCVSREDKGRSLTYCPVKVLAIKEFQGTMKEMHMIKHFLDYFPCLKELKIFYMENNGPTNHREVSEVIAEMMEHYNKSSSCNVHLLVSGYLYKKWTA